MADDSLDDLLYELGHVDEDDTDAWDVLCLRIVQYHEKTLAERDARIAELEPDARRYRRLKVESEKQYPDAFAVTENIGHSWETVHNLDAAIDEAMSND